MLWRFGFASTSTLDALLTRETPPSLEELLDEQDILAECKAQNNKLVVFLSREESIKGLLQWVTSGLDELDQQADTADEASFSHALSCPDLYPSYQVQASAHRAHKDADSNAISAPAVPRPGPDSPPFEPANLDDFIMAESVDSPPRTFSGLGQGLGGRQESSSGDIQRFRYSQVATEILTSELWTIPETVMAHKDTLLRPFWDAVIPPLDTEGTVLEQSELSERARARDEFWSEKDEERERRREMIRGMWMRVNASFLQKRTTEMVRFIQTLPNIIERLIARIESPAVQDMLARIVQSEEAGVSDVMQWLESERLIPRLLVMLSPHYPPSIHAIVTDLLKGIISVSAPNSAFNPHGGNAMEQQAGLQNPGGTKDNRLVRELTNGESIDMLVGYMLDSIPLTDEEWNGTGNQMVCPALFPADPFVIHPLPSIASATSSLNSVCNVLVEVIRRNNSDLAEPYLFNTLRNKLMGIQSAHMQQTTSTDDAENEDETRLKMEAALPDLADKLAIVHLGTLVAAISDRFETLHNFLITPRSKTRSGSALLASPLTTERFRIIELYAELLHSSNMSTLNRIPGTGPDYTLAGALTGGLDGLDKLGQALQAGEAGDDTGDSTEVEVRQARELPVSSGSTDYSLTESDDVPLSDDDEPTPSDNDDDDNATHALSDATPSQSPETTASAAADHPVPPVLEITVPPPPSEADAERLRDVMGIEQADMSSAATSEFGSVSHAAVAATTVAPSVASDIGEAHTLHPGPAEEPLSTGERLKQMYIRHRVLPTLLNLFFEYANNNFLHHLVYDILQQILNGQLGRGYNRELIIHLMCDARLIDCVLEAQRLNDHNVNDLNLPRLSYMGHMSLIAEELVKFFARCPADLFEVIRPSFDQAQWEAFVEGPLRDTRARDSQPLAGGKPMPSMGSSMPPGSERSDSESDDDDDAPSAAVTIGEPLSRTTASEGFLRQGMDTFHDSPDDDGAMEHFWRPRSGTGAVDSSDEDDDDADWLRPSSTGSRARRDSRNSDDDDFGAFSSPRNDEFASRHDDFVDDDDAWGTFTSVNTVDSSENPFGDDAFEPTSTSEVFNDRDRQAPLTPRDWAEAFDREFDSAAGEPSSSWPEGSSGNGTASFGRNSSEDGFVPAIVVPSFDEDGSEASDGDGDVLDTPTSSWSFPGDESDDQGEDLPPTFAVTAAGVTSSQSPTFPENAVPSPDMDEAVASTSAIRISSRYSGHSRESPAQHEHDHVEHAGRSHTTHARSRSNSFSHAHVQAYAQHEADLFDHPAAHIRFGEAISPPDPALIAAASEDEPLGPGVSSDTHLTAGGMLERQVAGETITVPQDEIARGVDEAIHAEVDAESSEDREEDE